MHNKSVGQTLPGLLPGMQVSSVRTPFAGVTPIVDSLTDCDAKVTLTVGGFCGRGVEEMSFQDVAFLPTGASFSPHFLKLWRRFFQ